MTHIDTYIESTANYLIEDLKYNIKYSETAIELFFMYIAFSKLLEFSDLTETQRTQILYVLNCIKSQIKVPETTVTDPQYLLLEDCTNGVGGLFKKE